MLLLLLVLVAELEVVEAVVFVSVPGYVVAPGRPSAVARGLPFVVARGLPFAVAQERPSVAARRVSVAAASEPVAGV